jgi:S1-C subfamily serine protease/HEAT repeat protein
MPRSVFRQACGQSYLVRDEFVGCQGRCACGRIHTVPTGPPVPAPTARLDSSGLMAGSLVLLVLSLGVGAATALWMGRDGSPGGVAENETPPVQVAANETKEQPPAAAGEKKETAKKEKEREEHKRPPKPPDESGPAEKAPERQGPLALDDRQLHEKLLRSVVWIFGTDGKKAWTGSGSVVHVGRRLIVTNHHVVNGQQRLLVLFPQRDPMGKLISEKKYYESLLASGKAHVANVLHADKERDLAVIQLEGRLPQDTLAIKVAPQPASQADHILLVGNPGVSEALWVPTSGSVRSRLKSIHLEHMDYPHRCLETALGTHGGDSGSPIVNTRGQLVAVHFARHLDPVATLKYAADRDEVLAVLREVNVKDEEVLGTEVLPPAGARVQALVKQVDDGNPEVCRKGVEGLARLDPAEARRAVPALVRALLRHEDETLRRAITDELQRIGPPVREDLDCLGAALGVAYKPARLYVIDALSQMGPDAQSAVPVLAQALKDRDNDVRRKAAQVLGSLGPLARRQAFRTLLATASAAAADEEVAKAALDALINLQKLTSAEIDLLIEALDDDKRWVCVRRYAAFHLGAQGPQAAAAVPALSRALQTSKDDNLLMFSAAALGTIGEKKQSVLKALCDLVNAPAAEKVRKAAVEALAKLLVGLQAEQIAEVRPLLQHKEPRIVLLGLNVVLDKKSAAGIEQDLAYLAKHDDAGVAVKAMDALWTLGSAARPAVPSLLAVLPAVPRARRLDVALAAAVGANDSKVAEAILPTLLEGLQVATIKERGEGTRSRIHTALVTAGQPAVDAIFKIFETIDYRGADKINYRKHLFMALEALGPTCKSRENYDLVKDLHSKERRYPDVQAAAGKALKAMEPN